MLHLTAAQFVRDAEKVTIGPREEVKQGDRQRGMWSFLTWSFFLAQALAAHEAFAKSHGAGADGASEDHGTGSAADAALKAALSGQPISQAGDDAAAAAAAQLSAAVAAGAITPAMWSAIGDNPVLFKALLDAMAAQQAAGGASPDSAAVAGDAALASADSHGSESVDGGLSGVVPDAGDLLPGIPHLPIEIIADLGLELGGHLVDTVDNLISAVAGTVVGTLDATLSATGELLTSVDSLLAATTGLVAGTVDTATSAVTGLVGGTLDSVTGIVDGIAGDTLGSVTTAANQLVGSVTHVATDTVSGLTDTLGPVTGVVSDVVSSGGSIVVGLASALAGPADALFSNGLHTDYGMELRTGAATGNDDLNGAGHANISAEASPYDIATFAHDQHNGLADDVGHTLNAAVDALGRLGDAWV